MRSQHLHNKHKWVQEKPFSCLGLHQGKAKRFPTEFLVFKHEMRCGQYTHQLDELGIPPIQLAEVDRWRGDLEHMVKRLQGAEWASADDISFTARAVNSMQEAAAFIFAPADFQDMNSYLSLPSLSSFLMKNGRNAGSNISKKWRILASMGTYPH